MHLVARQQDPTEPVLLALRQGRVREATSLAVEAHGHALGRFCMAMLASQAEADEVVQETFLAAYGSFSTYRGESSVRSFLFGIARHLCATKLAKRTRRERRLALVHDATTPDESVPELLERRARAMRMRAALDELKPTDREALLLRYEAGLPYAEIGALLGLDEAPARKRISRALVRLREIYGENES